jgi:chorismate mutase
MGFNPKAKRLRCIGHIFNLIAERYLYGQDVTKFKEQYSKAGAPERRKLWRERNKVGKLHNLIVYVIVLGKRTELFEAL